MHDDELEPTSKAQGPPSVTGVMRGARPEVERGLARRAGVSAVLEGVLDAKNATARFGRFEIRGKLGQGGMGIVYRAWDPRLERVIALKVLHWNDADPRKDRMLAEARMLARLKHPNVVAVHEAGEIDGETFVAMEFVEGVTLTQWLADRDEAAHEEILAVFHQAGTGLAAAHREGVVHRDFKPDNVIVGSDDRVQVVDFGLAQAQDRSDGGEIAGTWGYMAPEQRSGGPVDSRSDQYSFCVALWRALAPDVLPGAVQAPIHRRIRDALTRGLAEDPDRRWPDMEHLLQLLAPRTRAWWPALVLAPVAAAAIGGAVWMGQGDPAPSLEELCPDPRPQIEQAWGSEQRERIAAAFSADGRTADQTGLSTFLTRLDGLADDWVTAYSEACRLEHDGTVEHAQTGRDRIQCLDRVSGALEWFVDELPDLDDEARDRATLGVLALPTPADCATPDPDLRDVDGSLISWLHRGELALALLRLEDARELLEPTYEKAEEAGVHKLAAQTANHLSLVEFRAGRHDEGRTWARRGLAAAERIGDTELMIRSWCAKFSVEDAENNVDAAEFAVERAKSLSAQPGIPLALLAAVTWDEATLLQTKGEAEAAVPKFHEAVEKYERAGHPGDAARARCDIVTVQLDLGNMEDALAAGEACVDGLAALYGSEHGRLSIPLAMATNLALVAGMPEKAVELGRRTETVWRAAKGISVEQKAQVFALIAGASNETGDYARGSALLDEAIAMLAELEGEPAALVMVKVQYGVSLTEQGRCDAAMKHYDDLLPAYADRKDLPADQLAALYMNRAQCQAELGHPDDAMAGIEAAWSLKPHPEQSVEYLTILRFDAEISRLAGKLDRATTKLEFVLDNAEERGYSPGDIAFTRYLLARTRADRGQHEEARKQIALARPLFDAHATHNPKRTRDFREWVAGYEAGQGSE